MSNLCIHQTSHTDSAPLAYPFTLGWFTNNAALILPPEADQHQSEITRLSISESFTQRRVRRIGAGSPHANSSVNGVNDIIQSSQQTTDNVEIVMSKVIRLCDHGQMVKLWVWFFIY